MRSEKKYPYIALPRLIKHLIKAELKTDYVYFDCLKPRASQAFKITELIFVSLTQILFATWKMKVNSIGVSGTEIVVRVTNFNAKCYRRGSHGVSEVHESTLKPLKRRHE